jgi:hypothetical protein
MKNARSDKIFELAVKHGIPLIQEQVWPISDESYLAFVDEYKKWSIYRNKALEDHLRVRPNLFRVYLPYNQHVFALASNITWYLDEIIIADPISVVINYPRLNIEEAKLQLCQVLNVLSLFRNAIEDGYILLKGAKKNVDSTLDEPSEISIALSSDEEIQEMLLKSASYSFTEKDNSAGQIIKLYKASLGGSGIMGYQLNIPAGGTVTIPIDIDAEYPKTTLEELKGIFGEEPADKLRNIFPRVIDRTINATETASKLNSAVLFDRDYHDLILNKVGAKMNTKRQIATASMLNLTLPFVSGIPAERLMDLRLKIPDAFIDFRSNMLDIVNEAMSNADLDPNLIPELVKSKIVPQIRALDGEMNSTLKKSRILGYGIPLVSGAAILAGGALSAPITSLLAVGVGGAIGGIKAVADYEESHSKLQSNPFYFLWKVKH